MGGDPSTKFTVEEAGTGLWQATAAWTWGDLVDDLVDGGDLGLRLAQVVAEAPVDAVLWECPPTTAGSRAAPFSCIFARARGLERVRPDPGPMTERLPAPVNTFENLGGDAVLVAPAPPGDFAHLVPFCRTASEELQRDFWRSVGEAVRDWWAAERGPLWLSTSGLGVCWLHVRLDSRPKYYTHGPYRRAAPL